MKTLKVSCVGIVCAISLAACDDSGPTGVDPSSSSAASRFSAIVYARGDSVRSVLPDGTQDRALVPGSPVAVAPDRKRLTIARSGGQLFVLDLQTGLESRISTGSQGRWSADGSSVLVRRNDGWWAADVSTGLSTPVAGGGLHNPHWFPDGRSVLFTRYIGMDGADLIRVFIRRDRKIFSRGDRVIGDEAFEPFLRGFRIDVNVRQAFSPGGRHLLVTDCSDGRRCVKVLALESGEITSVSERGHSPAWSPDGSQIAYSVHDGMGGLWIGDPRGRSAERVIPGRMEEAPVRAVWSPDGERIAVLMVNWRVDAPTKFCVLTLADGTLECIAEGGGPLWVEALPPL